eukprot:6187699-Pleurochrysis_carterae.AAC.1
MGIWAVAAQEMVWLAETAGEKLVATANTAAAAGVALKEAAHTGALMAVAATAKGTEVAVSTGVVLMAAVMAELEAEKEDSVAHLEGAPAVAVLQEVASMAAVMAA